MGNFAISDLEDSLPSRLRPVFFRNASFGGSAIAAAVAFEQWFRVSGLPFFKEYTDHTFQHSLEAFKTACELISEDAYQILSSEDLVILFLACIVHDAGLHLTEDMFFKLVDKSNSSISVPQFDDTAWPNLWLDYVAEAKRFNEKKLISIFGDTNPISDPPTKSIDLTDRDRLLIGEFLRRHHTRLAHEIAVGHIHTLDGKALTTLPTMEHPLPDLIGLVARSHGMPLRSTFEYLKANYDLRDYRKIHLVFLMVVLRIADFLQIQSGRAPKFFRSTHRIRSPFSDNEWRVHESILNITPTSADPEAIYVQARPDTVAAFLRLSRWIADLQFELDTSWAVLGEVYGRFTKELLPNLKIALRRIRSNLDDQKDFQQTVDYVPAQIKFTVDEAELLRLLLAPLYGDDPLFGLRELTQNSADSVNEFQHRIAAGLGAPRTRVLDDCDIEIEVDLSSSRFVIRDRGAGMTLEIIEDYFLKAGASFRNSETWKREFVDDAGKSKVARAGRFGVGALSAFLIGDKVDVYTRHYSEPTGFGYRFTAALDADAISVERQRGPVGTEITIEARPERLKRLADYLRFRWKLSSFFYRSNTHIVCLKVIDEDGTSERIEVRPISLKGNAEWTKIEGTDYDAVYRKKISTGWATYEMPDGRHFDFLNGHFFCNELLVGEIDRPSYNILFSGEYSDGLFSFNYPTVSVTDNGGKLPLNLPRKHFAAADRQLQRAVQKSMIEEYVAAAFQCAGETPRELFNEPMTQADLLQIQRWNRFVFGKKGFALFDFGILKRASVSRIAVGHGEWATDQPVIDSLDQRSVLAVQSRPFTNSNKREVLDHLRWGALHWIGSRWENRRGLPRRYEWTGATLVDVDIAKSVKGVKKLPKYIEHMIVSGPYIKIGKRNYLQNSDPRTKKDDHLFLIKLAAVVEKSTKNTEGKRAFSIWREGEHAEDTRQTLLSEVWFESFNVAFLPYGHSKRRNVLKSDAPILRFFK